MSEKEENVVINELSSNENIVTIVICTHEWTTDYIDISPELSKKICYCIKCEITKS